MKSTAIGTLMVDFIIIKLSILKKPEEGIQELRYIDAMKMRYVRKQKKDEKADINRLNPLRKMIQWITFFQS